MEEAEFLALAEGARMKPVWLTAACLATLLLIACGPQEPIRIGFIGELTGNSADLGEAGRNGAMLAIEQANQGGGINGRPIELLARDTGSTRPPPSTRPRNCSMPG
jgi:ABC-type branched-subunit amino acid transport system substrate-binding protein